MMDCDVAIGAKLAALLAYPGESFPEQAAQAADAVETVCPEAARHLLQFSAATLGLSSEDREELYTRTFDINPVCALEIGWQLFGEEYHRGALLVRLRQELSRYGVEETAELPDHLVHVLPLLDRMPDQAGADFAHACVLPALGKMREGFAEKADNPYGHVLRAVTLLLEARFGPSPQGNDHE